MVCSLSSLTGVLVYPNLDCVVGNFTIDGRHSAGDVTEILRYHVQQKVSLERGRLSTMVSRPLLPKSWELEMEELIVGCERMSTGRYGVFHAGVFRRGGMSFEVLVYRYRAWSIPAFRSLRAHLSLSLSQHPLFPKFIELHSSKPCPEFVFEQTSWPSPPSSRASSGLRRHRASRWTGCRDSPSHPCGT